MNGTFAERLWSWTDTYEDSSRFGDAAGPTCEGIDLNNTYGTRLQDTWDYDVAMNFPVVDIMTFFSWLQYDHNYGRSAWSIHVKAVCLRPGEVREGSRTPRSAKEVLDDAFGVENDQNDDGGDDDEDDESGAGEVFGLQGRLAWTWTWTVATMVAAMFIL